MFLNSGATNRHAPLQAYQLLHLKNFKKSHQKPLQIIQAIAQHKRQRCPSKYYIATKIKKVFNLIVFEAWQFVILVFLFLQTVFAVCLASTWGLLLSLR
jgi:uncharacterized membrane protein